MPRDVDVDFLAIDEVQLAGDPERGHVFTDRLLHARGRSETLLLGAQTMREAISDLVPGANFISRPRLSKLSYAGQKKITRLPQRSAVVAFSAAEVYSIAELIRRQRGGAAPQSRRRPRGVLGRPQVRRAGLPQSHARRAEPDRGPRRPPYERR
jgi:ATP-dependent RNA helicase SUPV3L1/SUV3